MVGFLFVLPTFTQRCGSIGVVFVYNYLANQRIILYNSIELVLFPR